jgi:hypothetical protein
MEKMTPEMNAPRAYGLLMSAIVASLLIQPSPASAAAPQVRKQAPGFYRMVLGDFEITALLDGTHPFPAAEVLTTRTPDLASGRAKLSRRIRRRRTIFLPHQISRRRPKDRSTPFWSTPEPS